MIDTPDNPPADGNAHEPPFVRAIREGVVCLRCGGSKYKGRALCDACCAAIGPAARAALCCGADEFPAAWAKVTGAATNMNGEKR